MLSTLSRLFRGRSKAKATTDHETPLQVPLPLPALSLVSEPRSRSPSYKEAPSPGPSYPIPRSRHTSYEGPRSRRPSHERPRSRLPSQTSAHRSRQVSVVSMPSSPRERKDALVPSRAHSNASNRASNAYMAIRTRHPRSRVQSQSERAVDRSASTVDTANTGVPWPTSTSTSTSTSASSTNSPQVDRTPTRALGTTKMSGACTADPRPEELVDEVQEDKVRLTSARGGGVMTSHRPPSLARAYTYEDRYGNHSGPRPSPPSAPPTPAAQWAGWIVPFNEDLASDDHERKPNRVADWLSHTRPRHPDPPVPLGASEDSPSASTFIRTVPTTPQGHGLSSTETPPQLAPTTISRSGKNFASEHVAPLSEPVPKEPETPELKPVGDTRYENSLGDSAVATQDSTEQRTIDTQPSYDESELAQTKIGALSGQMSPESMFKCLVERGCPDITSDMNPERYSKGMVAAGGIGDIHRGELQDGTSVAIKMWRIFEYQTKSVKRATREIYNWSKMDHDNVHKLLGAIMLDGRIGMVSRWMDNGDLQAYMRKNQAIDRYDLCLQVTKGVQYLHNVGIVHGDLKAVNILVSAGGVPKLTDFDHSIILDGTLMFSDTTQTGGGTSRWMAPELHADEAPCRNKQTDIYALGMTLLEIITGMVPYSECSNDIQVIRKIDRATLPKQTEHFTQGDRGPRLWDLLVKCWDRDPDARPTADSVLQLLFLLIDETTPLLGSKT